MGHHHYAQNLLSELPASDCDVSVWYIETGEEPAIPESVEAHPLATARHGTFLVNVAATLYYHVQFLALLLFSRPDVVHFNTLFRNQYHTLMLSLAIEFARIRIVRTVHELTEERLRTISALERATARRVFRTADHLIVHTEETRKELRSRRVETPATVLPHGNYLSFREHLPETDVPPLPVNEEPVVLFFGPKDHKGINVFADAVNQSTETYTTWLAGPVAEDAEEAVGEIIQRPRAHCKRGYLDNAELARIFDAADIVVLPYTAGTTSGAVHLALAFRNAVVASDLSCFTSVVEDGHNGVLTKRGDKAALATALDDLATDAERVSRLASAGYTTECSDRFDWNRLAEKTRIIYNDRS